MVKGQRSTAFVDRRLLTVDNGESMPVKQARKAAAVDETIAVKNLRRLRRIEGQVRGQQKMVEEDRYCADIMTQIASVHEALRAVSRELMRNHLKHCATTAIRSDDPVKTNEMYDELIELMFRHVR
jgi:DNA-binding FrmR family transcriptional regulator